MYTIRDAIYGSVPLSAAAYATLDTTAFQRLKHLKQIGPAYLVYPGGTHTRFSHSIGVYHLARLALQHLGERVAIEAEIARATLAAALLHDLGHFPYSHVIDELSLQGTHLSHSELSVDLVETDPELQAVLIDRWEVDPSLVADLIAGRASPRIPRFLYTLIDGPMDVDKLDYLNRDAHHTGVPYGKVEVQRLIEFLDVDPATGDLVIREAGVGTVESVIFAKYLMFRYVYWHHTARTANAMINRAALDCFLALGQERLSVHDARQRRVCLATDGTLGSVFRELLAESGAEPPPSLALLDRVEQRRLYKRVQVVPCAEAGGDDALYRDALARRERENRLAAAAAGSATDGSAVLIDVPPSTKFMADIRGILTDGDDGRAQIIPWERAPQGSYLTAATVAAMEQRIRSVLYLCDAEALDGTLREKVRAVLARGDME